MTGEQWITLTNQYKVHGAKNLSEKDIALLLEDAEKAQFPASYIVDGKEVSLDEYITSFKKEIKLLKFEGYVRDERVKLYETIIGQIRELAKLESKKL